MADSGGSTFTTYTTIAAVQIGIVVIMILVGSWLGLKNNDLSDKFILNVAQTVVIFLPLALAWFGIFSSIFLQNMNLLLPILTGVAAVGANILVDSGFKRFIVDAGIAPNIF